MNTIKNLTAAQFAQRIEAIKAGQDYDFDMVIRFAQTALCNYSADKAGNPKLVQYGFDELAKFKGRNAWAGNYLRVANLIRRKAGNHLAFVVDAGMPVYAEVTEPDGFKSLNIAQIKVAMLGMMEKSVAADAKKADKKAEAAKLSDVKRENRSAKSRITGILNTDHALLTADTVAIMLEGLEKEIAVLKAMIKPAQVIKKTPKKAATSTKLAGLKAKMDSKAA